MRLQQAQRDEAGTDDALAHMQEIALQSDATEVDDRFADFVQARLALMRGNLTAALGWAEAKGYDQIKVPIRLEQPGEPIISHLFKYEALVLARVWIANGHAHDARALLLQPLCAWLAGRERLDLEIEAAILCALSWHAEGELAKAYTCLEGALILAQPGNYIRIFVDEGQELQKLLNHLSPKDKKLAHYVRQLQAAYNLDSVPGPISAPQQPLIEPLSERELQILQLIANGLTNREVAQELILSLPTVKWHTSNIYGKLGVKNRTTAVAKARSLQIIPAL